MDLVRRDLVSSEGSARRTSSKLPACPASCNKLVEIQLDAQLRRIRQTCRSEDEPDKRAETSYLEKQPSKRDIFLSDDMCLLSRADRPLSSATRFQAETTSAYGRDESLIS